MPTRLAHGGKRMSTHAIRAAATHGKHGCMGACMAHLRMGHADSNNSSWPRTRHIHVLGGVIQTQHLPVHGGGA
jgi:hypothetical protein